MAFPRNTSKSSKGRLTKSKLSKLRIVRFDRLSEAIDGFKTKTSLIESNKPNKSEGSRNIIMPVETARRMRDARLARQILIPSDLLCDPVWDMLIHLFIAAEESQRTYVTPLCVASNAPMATALRYIDKMIDEGMVQSIKDEFDGRRKCISLSATTHNLIEAYFKLVT